jgi:carboxypeptidase T
VRRSIVILTVCCVLLYLLSLPTAGAHERATLVMVNAATREQRTEVANVGVAIEEVRSTYVLGYALPSEIAQLQAMGYTVEPIYRASDFPPQHADYHNYAEMVAELNQVIMDHADIVDMFSIGQTWEGRELWTVKISDNPEVDEDEPEVLYIGHQHAREHLTVEMMLFIVNYLTDSYGLSDRVTNLVNSREVYVMVNTNPDGGEYDIATGSYRYWRKNRRDNGDGTYGVDLNRNWGYMFDCGGASDNPASDTYHGPYAFSEPETRAIRDFVANHPDITVSLDFHTYGEMVLWPYGYTFADVPPDMSAMDHQVFVIMGQSMASTNGYTPMQSSDLYIASGIYVDWMYGAHGIFAFTFEMYPQTSPPGFYPDDEVIPRETLRNLEAVLFSAEVADDPYQVLQRPLLQVDPKTLVFRAVEGAPPPQSQNIAITNQGAGTLDWTATTDVAWISMNPDTGTAPSVMAVWVDTTGLSPNTYAGTITVTAATPDTLASPQTIRVTLVVGSCPATVTLEQESRESDLNLLRRFRDEILLTSPVGRKYAKLYYKHAPEVTWLLLSDAELRTRTRETLEKLMPGLRGLLDAGIEQEMVLSEEVIGEMEALMSDFAARASPELQAVIGELEGHLVNLEGKALKEIR